MSGNIRLREASAGDVDAIARIEAQAFAEDPWTLSMLAETVASSDSPVIVAVDAVDSRGARGSRDTSGASSESGVSSGKVGGSDASGAGGTGGTSGTDRASSESAETVIGYAAVLAAQGASEADVLTIAVDATARGRGIGRLLLVELAAIARSRGAHQLFLEVRASNTVAQNLYRSEGFESIGVRAHYYQPDGEDAVVMRLDLHRERGPRS